MKNQGRDIEPRPVVVNYQGDVYLLGEDGWPEITDTGDRYGEVETIDPAELRN